MDDKALLTAYRFAIRQTVQAQIIAMITASVEKVVQDANLSVEVEYSHSVPSASELEAEMEQDIMTIINTLYKDRIEELYSRNPQKAKKFIAGKIDADQFGAGARWQKKMLRRIAKVSQQAVDLEWQHNLQGLEVHRSDGEVFRFSEYVSSLGGSAG